MPQTIPMRRCKMDSESMEIHPLGDLHVGSREFDESAFLRWRDMILSKPNRYVVLLGDIVDNSVKSSVGSPYDAVLQPREQRIHAAELLAPIKDRIIAAVSGNHCYRTNKDTDTDPMEIVLSKLNLEHLYSPEMMYLYVSFPRPASHSVTPPQYTVLLTHGNSGGMLIGAGLNRMEPYAMAMGADLMITGHTHKPSTAPLLRYVPNSRGVMTAREVRIMVCTGWLSYAGYPARKMLRPVPIAPNYAVLDGREYKMRVVT